jgi:hypothetical protein
MSDLEDIEKAYPESTALTGLAVSVWNGNTQPAKVDITVTDRLKAEFQKLL